MPSGRKPMNKHDARSVRVSICLQPAEDRKIRKAANKMGLTMSTYIRLILRQSLKL
jgi:antitoxin component of RelBE/YafQ-DinJ toxin-antitoxin module